MCARLKKIACETGRLERERERERKKELKKGKEERETKIIIKNPKII